MSRQSGYYWVKRSGSAAWSIAEFVDDMDVQYWLLTDEEYGRSEFELYEINETRILAPDEVASE